MTTPAYIGLYLAAVEELTWPDAIVMSVFLVSVFGFLAYLAKLFLGRRK